VEEPNGLPVQLAFDGAVVSEKIRPFRESLNRPKTRRVPLDALHDVCDLGYRHVEDQRPEPFTQTGRFAERLTSVLVQAGTFLVIANWAKVRRAASAGECAIDVVDVLCADDEVWWALLAEVREIKQRDWARRLYVAFRRLPEDVVGALSLRDWEAVLDVDFTSLSWLRKPLPAELEARVLAGDLSVWSAYPRVAKTDEGGPADEASQDVVATVDAYDSSATVRETIERTGLGGFVNVTSCLRAPQRFVAAARASLAYVDQQLAWATAADTSSRRKRTRRC